MKMRRNIAILFAVLLSGAQLTGCGKYEAVETAAEAGAAVPGDTAAAGDGTEKANVSGDMAAPGNGTVSEKGAAVGDGTKPGDGAAPENGSMPGNEAGAGNTAGDIAGAAAGAAGTPVELAAGENGQTSGGPQSEMTDQQFLDNTGMAKEEAAAFVSSFLAAVKADDKEAVADMINYPRKVKTPDWEGTVNNSGEFLSYYDGIFTEDFKQKLEGLSAADLFYSDGMIAAGDGCLWFYPATAEADMSVGTINAAEDRYVRYGGPSGVQPG